jgi:prevent-host-death family protein
MIVTIHEAKTYLSRLLHKVEEGEEVLVCRGKHPVARLVPAFPVKNQRPPDGTPTSEPFNCSKDAFDPLSDDELKVWGMA